MAYPYTNQGLRNFAKLLDEWLRDQEGSGIAQNTVADRVGVSAGTIKKLREGTNSKPDPESIASFGGYIPKPGGGLYSSDELFFNIACEVEGNIVRAGERQKYTGPNEKAVNYLLDRQGHLSITSFAIKLGIPEAELEKVLSGELPSLPTVMNIAAAMGAENATELLGLYGVDLNSKIVAD